MGIVKLATKRIGIAGFLHESNTFLAVATVRKNFEDASLTKGPAVLQRWTDSKHELGGFIEGAKQFGFMAIPIMATYAIPGGAITSETFDKLLDELEAEIVKNLPLDGLLLALHGATVSENFPDADGEISRRVRQIVGINTSIIATLDLHANVSAKMAAHTNATVIYRTNPHIDQQERGLEAASLMARTLTREITPVQALECPPMLINISSQYTQRAPAAHLYDDALEVMNWPGILSASVAMGFYYADVEEMGASFIAVAHNDAALATKAAKWMAHRAWKRRHSFTGKTFRPTEAVLKASQSAQTPVVLMDMGDNVGGGSAGDGTILLQELMQQGIPNGLVVLYDPDTVKKCVAAGVRNELTLKIGAKTDHLHGTPVTITGRVRTISDGLFVETKVRHGGWGLNDQGVTAVIETADRHTIVVTSRRMAPLSLEQLLSLGVKPETKTILIVKGVIAPRAAYQPIAAEILLVDTPGSTSANPSNFIYHRRRNPLYPLEHHALYAPL